MKKQSKAFLKKGIVATTLCGLLLQGTEGSLLLTTNVQAAEVVQAVGAINEVQSTALEQAQAWLLNNGKLSDWAAIGLARNNQAIPQSFRLDKGDEVLNNRSVYGKASELSLAIMGYSAAGVNVSNVAGVNMMERLVNHSGMENEGAYGLALAFLAYGYNRDTSYDRPNWYSDRWVNKLIELQNSDGSWSEKGSTTGEFRSTALAIAALTYDPYAQPSDMKEILAKAAKWMVTQQQEDGSFAGSTLETAYGVMGLIAIQSAGTYSEQIDKAITYLLTKQTATGSFTDLNIENEEAIVTEQTYLALTANKLQQAKKGALLSGWYKLGPRQVTVSIEGPNGQLASGTSTGYTVEEAVYQYLKENKIPFTLSGNYKIGNENNSISGYAQAYASIGSVANGNSNQKAWRYGIQRTYLIDDHFDKTTNLTELTNGDKILVYFGAADKPVYTTFAVQAEGTKEYSYMSPVYQENHPFLLKIEKPVYATNSYSMQAAAGITVQLNGRNYTTDKNGLIKVLGLEAGKYPLIIEDAGGSIVTNRYTLTVASPDYTQFKDQNDISEWARLGIGHGLVSGIIKGTSKSPMLLSPKKTVTRAEFTIMLTRVLEEFNNNAKSNPFNDVKSNQWYSKEISIAHELGITDVMMGNFRPSSSITREEAAIMLVKAGQLTTYGSESRHLFNDINKLSVASKAAIQAVDEHRIMQGDKTTFRPSSSLTREEAATVIMRIDNYINRLTVYGYNDTTY